MNFNKIRTLKNILFERFTVGKWATAAPSCESDEFVRLSKVFGNTGGGSLLSVGT